MWNISSLAQRVSSAAARIEHEINDSVGHVDEGFSSILPGTKEGLVKTDENESDYFRVEEEEVNFGDTDGNAGESMTQAVSTADDNSGNGGWVQCDDIKNINSENEGGKDLVRALTRIEELESELLKFKKELDAAKDESKSYRIANLELEQQVRDLTEENMSLKLNAASKDSD